MLSRLLLWSSLLALMCALAACNRGGGGGGGPPPDLRPKSLGMSFEDAHADLGMATFRTRAIADLDGDGLADLIGRRSLSPIKDTLAILLRRDGGFVEAATGIPKTVTGANHVAVADLDGDKDLDLAVTAGACWVLLNDGKAGFVATEIPLQWRKEKASTVAFADVDGDGDLDLLVGGSVSRFLFLRSPAMVVFNDGKGRFGSPRMLPHETVLRSTTVTGDFNGDGNVDYVEGYAADCGSTFCDKGVTPSVGLGDGRGGFTGRTVGVSLSTERCHSGDFDGDGDLDLIFAGTHDPHFNPTPTSYLLLNDGKATFVQAPIPSNRVRIWITVDFDGDKDIDALVEGEDGWEWWLNDGKARWTRSTKWKGPGATEIIDRAHDVDGDGRLDLIGKRILYGTASGRFVPRGGPAALPAVKAPHIIDLDGDGRADLVDGGSASVAWNDGDGGFTRGWSLGNKTANSSLRQAAVGDVDADNDLDIVFGEPSGVHVVTQSPGRRLTASKTTVPGGTSLALLDLDLDKDADLIVSGVRGAFAYINNRGSFVQGKALPTKQPRNARLHAADFDLDGRDDILVASDQGARLWLQRTDGSFADATNNLGTASSASSSEVIVDIDGDGDLDIVLHVPDEPSAIGIWMNGGLGTAKFTPLARRFGQKVTSPLRAGEGIAAADINGDGRVDILQWTQNWRGDRLLPLLNQGGGVFQRSSLPQDYEQPWLSTGLFAGDLDGDRDVDLLLAGSKPLFIRNTRRDLRRLPNRPGQNAWRLHARINPTVTGSGRWLQAFVSTALTPTAKHDALGLWQLAPPTVKLPLLQMKSGLAVFEAVVPSGVKIENAAIQAVLHHAFGPGTDYYSNPILIDDR